MPYTPNYVDAENTFHTWGTIHAFDALNAGPTNRSYTDDKVLDELSAYPLDANINYLTAWLRAQGEPALSDGRLPSSRDWALSSNAYAQIAFDWPEHARRISSDRLARLIQVGTELRAAIQRISTDTASGNTKGNERLFNFLENFYRRKRDQLLESIRNTEENYVIEVQKTVLRRNETEAFDLWGGRDQKLP